MTWQVSIRVNGTTERATVPDRLTLADYLRDHTGRTGTKLGCEQGVCGACTVLLDGASARSCLVLAAQADDCSVDTVEGIVAASPAGHALREAFARHDALQCGFCTPGFLVTGVELLAREHLDEAAVRTALSGNLCRCTGYGGIVAAILDVRARHGRVPLTTGGPERPSTVDRRRLRAVTGAVLLGGALVGLGVLVRHARKGTA